MQPRMRTPYFSATLTVLVGLSGAYAADGPACSVIPLPHEADNAPAIADKLNGITDNVTVRALSPTILMLCADPSTAAELNKAVMELAAKSQPARAPESDSHSVRLFFNRDAAAVAKVLDGVYKGIAVQPVGPDTLLFQTSDRNQEENIHELKRWVSLLDVPRPELSLNVWNVQLSSKNLTDLNEQSTRIRAAVSHYNQRLHDSLQRAWRFLAAAGSGQGFYDDYFSDYVVQRTEDPKATSLDLPSCGKDRYCLGFGQAFRPLPPGLTQMLGVLAASADPATADRFVDCLEGRDTCGWYGQTLQRRGAADLPARRRAPRDRSQEEHADCEALDTLALDGDAGPAYNCFRSDLREALQPERKALLRVALANFLFQYKFATEHPHDFSSFDYSNSAQTLDTQFDPLLVAFNRDVSVFLRHLQGEVLQGQTRLKGVSFASNGTVSLRTISGTDSEVDTTTQNAFATTPPPLVQDAEKNGSALFKANLPTHAADALTAFLNSGRSSVVSLGKALTLKLSPVSLPTASAAELKIHLESKDDAAPQVVAADGTTKADTTDRVSQQTVDTSVRVDSLKLFEVSAFSAALSRGREPIPLLPPFVALPYVGSFVNLKLPPSTVFHQTIAIVSAVVVPTAADLLSGLRFKWDTAPTSQPAVLPAVRKFHERKLVCIAGLTNPRATAASQADCANLRLDPAEETQVASNRASAK